MPKSFVEIMAVEARRLFDPDALEISVARLPDSWTPESEFNPGIRVVHKPSGIGVSCDKFGSQQENLIAAIVQLRVKIGG